MSAQSETPVPPDDSSAAAPASGTPAAAEALTAAEAPAAAEAPTAAQPVPEPAPAWTPPPETAPAWTPPTPPSDHGSGAVVADRPEIALGAAFAGGLVLALVLKRLAR